MIEQLPPGPSSSCSPYTQPPALLAAATSLPSTPSTVPEVVTEEAEGPNDDDDDEGPEVAALSPGAVAGADVAPDNFNPSIHKTACGKKSSAETLQTLQRGGATSPPPQPLPLRPLLSPLPPAVLAQAGNTSPL